MDYGLIGGLAEGLKSGLDSYKDMSRYNQALALQKRMANMKSIEQESELQSRNQTLDDSGHVALNDLGQAEQSQKMGTINATRESMDPASQRSKIARDSARATLRVTSPGLENAITDDMSDAQVAEMTKEGLIGKTVGGIWTSRGMEARAKAYAAGNNIKQGQLDERTNQNATQAGQAFEHDPIIKQTKQTLNNLARAESLMNGKTPITSSTFNLLNQDFIQATAPGGVATEGKINREQINTFMKNVNELQQKYGSIQDLRTQQPQIFNQLRGLISTIKEDYGHAQATQAADIHDSYSQSTNEKVQKTIRDKLGRYAPNEYKKRYGGASGLVPAGLIQTPQQAPDSDRVNMVGPDGKVRSIPKDQVDAAIAAGGKVAQ